MINNTFVVDNVNIYNILMIKTLITNNVVYIFIKMIRITNTFVVDYVYIYSILVMNNTTFLFLIYINHIFLINLVLKI